MAGEIKRMIALCCLYKIRSDHEMHWYYFHRNGKTILFYRYRKYHPQNCLVNKKNQIRFYKQHTSKNAFDIGLIY